MAENPVYHNNFINAGDSQGAADNATDMPRNYKDIGATSEVITGTGDQMPVQVESKNLHFGANDALAKGHDRYDKHTRQKESDLERYQGEGAGVDVPPGDEGVGQDEMRDAKGLWAGMRVSERVGVRRQVEMNLSNYHPSSSTAASVPPDIEACTPRSLRYWRCGKR